MTKEEIEEIIILGRLSNTLVYLSAESLETRVLTPNGTLYYAFSPRSYHRSWCTFDAERCCLVKVGTHQILKAILGPKYNPEEFID